MPIKSVKMKISKNKKMRFFLMSQGSLNPKIRFLGQKVWPVACAQTHRVTTEGTISGFQDFFLQPIIKDRPNLTKKWDLLLKKTVLCPCSIKHLHLFSILNDVQLHFSEIISLTRQGLYGKIHNHISSMIHPLWKTKMHTMLIVVAEGYWSRR